MDYCFYCFCLPTTESVSVRKASEIPSHTVLSSKGSYGSCLNSEEVSLPRRQAGLEPVNPETHMSSRTVSDCVSSHPVNWLFFTPVLGSKEGKSENMHSSWLFLNSWRSTSFFSSLNSKCFNSRSWRGSILLLSFFSTF